jgi:hypothetical protein
MRVGAGVRAGDVIGVLELELDSLIEMIEVADHRAGIDDLIHSLIQEVVKHSSGLLRDDATLLGLEYLGTTGGRSDLFSLVLAAATRIFESFGMADRTSWSTPGPHSVLGRGYKRETATNENLG